MRRRRQKWSCGVFPSFQPRRSSRRVTLARGCIAQWLGALPEIDVAPDGSIDIVGVSELAPECHFDSHAHAGLLAFLDAASVLERAPVRVKAQVTGPLTLGVALRAAGMPEQRAFRRAAAATRAWSVALEELLSSRLPDTSVVLFFDEPALVAWRRGDAPLDRESAIDVLSGALAAVDCVTGVHVCGDGDLGLALEAGPQVLGVEVSEALVRDTIALARFLDGDGWIAWARSPPTDPSANRPTRTGGDSRRCGASSRAAGAIRCHSVRAASSLRLAGSRVMVPRKQSGCSVSRGSSLLASTTRPLRPASRWEPDLEPTSYRYCGVCGQPLEPGAVVCGNCGAAVEPTADDAETGEIVGSDTGDATPASGEPTIAMTAAGAGVAGAAGAGAAGGGGGGQPPDQTDDGGMSPAQRWLIAALIVLAIVLVGVIAALALSGGGNDKTPTTTTSSTSTTTSTTTSTSTTSTTAPPTTTTTTPPTTTTTSTTTTTAPPTTTSTSSTTTTT